MKKVFLFVIILASLKSFAQNKTIDSLKLALVSAKEDTNKVWILDALSGSIRGPSQIPPYCMRSRN
jgi:hypothetical protein